MRRPLCRDLNMRRTNGILLAALSDGRRRRALRAAVSSITRVPSDPVEVRCLSRSLELMPKTSDVAVAEKDSYGGILKSSASTSATGASATFPFISRAADDLPQHHSMGEHRQACLFSKSTAGLIHRTGQLQQLFLKYWGAFEPTAEDQRLLDHPHRALSSLAVFFHLVSGGQGALIDGMRRISDLAKIGVLGTLLGAIIRSSRLCPPS